MNTDSDVMKTYLDHLVKLLDTEQPDWRHTHAIIIDGARYHTSQSTRDHFSRLRIPVIILSGYMYKAAPIELFYAYLKKTNLNPQQLKTSKK